MIFGTDHVETVPPPVQCEDVECEGGEDEYISLGPCEQDFCHCSGGIPLLDVRRGKRQMGFFVLF